ncbi:MAG: hypothetical protein F6K29_32350, partial [Okeania sp. SIO2G5]|nr:hypothetical protein [Okeania sp. SIO2G5]
IVFDSHGVGKGLVAILSGDPTIVQNQIGFNAGVWELMALGLALIQQVGGKAAG